MSTVRTADKPEDLDMIEEDLFVIERQGAIRRVRKENAALGKNGVLGAQIDDSGNLILLVSGEEGT